MWQSEDQSSPAAQDLSACSSHPVPRTHFALPFVAGKSHTIAIAAAAAAAADTEPTLEANCIASQGCCLFTMMGHCLIKVVESINFGSMP